MGLPQEKAFHEFDGWYHTLAVVSETEPDLTLRWGALLHDVAKGMPSIRQVINGRYTDRGHDNLGSQMAYDILIRLGYNKKFASRVSWIVKNHMRFISLFKMKRQMRKNGFARKLVVVSLGIVKACVKRGNSWLRCVQPMFSVVGNRIPLQMVLWPLENVWRI